MVKTENVKLVILLDYKNTKIFLEKVTLQISLKKFLWLKKLKILCREYITLMILTVKKLRKNCNFLWKGIAKQKSKKVFRIEKVIKRKGNKLYVKWKGYNNSFNNSKDK